MQINRRKIIIRVIQIRKKTKDIRRMSIRGRKGEEGKEHKKKSEHNNENLKRAKENNKEEIKLEEANICLKNKIKKKTGHEMKN